MPLITSSSYGSIVVSETAVWDPASNLNMTFVSDTVVSDNSSDADPMRVLTFTFKSSGKYYLEFTTSTNNIGGCVIGLAPATYDGVWTYTPNYTYYPYWNRVYINGILQADIGGDKNNTVIGMAYDADTNVIAIYSDNVLVDSRSWSPGVAVSPMCRGDESGHNITSTTTWSGFTYTPPAGHVAWPNS